MVVDSALIKPVADAIMDLLKLAKTSRLTKQAESNIREAIKDLLLANPNEDKAEAAILAARAANLLSPDLLLAERMLEKVRTTKKAAAIKKVAKKKVAKKKAVARKAARKKR